MEYKFLIIIDYNKDLTFNKLEKMFFYKRAYSIKKTNLKVLTLGSTAIWYHCLFSLKNDDRV